MMRHRLSNTAWYTAACCVFLLPAMGRAQTAPLAADAYINPGSGLKYGGATAVAAGGAAGSRGLLRFDLSGLPGPGGSVAWARLRFYVYQVTTAGAVDIAAANAAWEEASVTGVGGPAAGALVQAGVAIASPGWVTVDVTSQVASWLGGSPNYGFMLSANPATTEVYIDSKESVATSHPATLEVVFSGAAGAQGPEGAPGATGQPGAAGPVGPVGPVGNTGAQGPPGPSGAAGPSGPAGAMGATGDTGAAGAAGPAGPSGAAGAMGPAGPNGPTGPTGAAGALGAAGPTGPMGFIGADGPAGPTGPTGPAGADGATDSVTTLAGGATISDSDTHFVFYVNNSAAAPTIYLPHASSGAGKQIRIQATVPWNGKPLTIRTQGSDGIWDTQYGTPALTSDTHQGSVTYVSGGGTRWLVLWAN